MTLSIPTTFAPMEAKSVEALPDGEGWRFEPKWDGFRCLAFRDGVAVDLRAKSGKPLGRYFPEMVEALKRLPAERFVIDGELGIPVNGSLSFDALQLRLHPAESRVRKLAAQTPSILIVFDLLETPAGETLTDQPLTERRAALEAFMAGPGKHPSLTLSPQTADLTEARVWLEQAGGALDGVIAKRADGPYASGERTMLKVKQLRTADCVVGGFRYAKDSKLVGSLLLGLYNERGLLDHVGFTSTISDAERAGITSRLEALTGGEGFTGKAPGGPSRWSTERLAEWTPLKPKLVVEVRYDHVSGGRFRHGTKIMRWRPDKNPRQCTFEQIAPPAPIGLFA
ncbi:MAG TPA: ATP-dependent DNA ligase [Caulobacteraceae bacterium]